MPSFDIVSKTDKAEVGNAVAGVVREISQRFDFKGARCTIEYQDDTITIVADDEPKRVQMEEMLKVHFTRRKLEVGALDWGKAERAAGDARRQEIKVKQGIAQDLAKTLVKSIKDSKLKVQAAIQGDELRVTGKKIDDLQTAIAMLKGLKIEQPLQYVNFRD